MCSQKKTNGGYEPGHAVNLHFCEGGNEFVSMQFRAYCQGAGSKI